MLNYLFIDRTEIRMLLINETLVDLLEYSSLHDGFLISELQRECEEMDSACCNIWESITKNDHLVTFITLN